MVFCKFSHGIFFALLLSFVQGTFLSSAFAIEKRFTIIDNYNPQEYTPKSNNSVPPFNPEYVKTPYKPPVSAYAQKSNNSVPSFNPEYAPPYNPNPTAPEYPLLQEEKKRLEKTRRQLTQESQGLSLQAQDVKQNKEWSKEQLESMLISLLQSQAKTQETIEQNSQKVDEIHLKIEKNLQQEDSNIYKILRLTGLGIQKVVTTPLKGMQSVFFGCLTYSWAVKVTLSLSPFIGIPGSLPLVVGVVAAGLDYFVLD